MQKNTEWQKQISTKRARTKTNQYKGCPQKHTHKKKKDIETVQKRAWNIIYMKPELDVPKSTSFTQI